jgi:hypothetical protein
MLLFEVYAKAVEVPNGRGSVPLHLACYYGSSSEIIKMLAEAFPLAMQVKNRSGNTPVDLAESSGISSFLECLNKQRLMKEEDHTTTTEINSLRAEMEDIRSSIADMKHEFTSDMKQMKQILHSLIDEKRNKTNA